MVKLMNIFITLIYTLYSSEALCKELIAHLHFHTRPHSDTLTENTRRRPVFSVNVSLHCQQLPY